VTPAEHHEQARKWLHGLDALIDSGEPVPYQQSADMIARAQVHATLALAPAAAPLPRPKPKPAARVEVFDVQLNHLVVTTIGSAGMDSTGAVVLNHPATDWSTVLDDPAQVRLLADTLTAHADRMDNR
jgi:hypothetical protein